MSDSLDAAQVEHEMISGVVILELEGCDAGPVEAFAMIAVRDLLAAHQPELSPGGGAVVCADCRDDGLLVPWPCEVYEVIEKATHHGE